jgi:hypothetical protein
MNSITSGVIMTELDLCASAMLAVFGPEVTVSLPGDCIAAFHD